MSGDWGKEVEKFLDSVQEIGAPEMSSQDFVDGLMRAAYNQGINDAIERLKLVMPSYLMTTALLSLRKKEGG